MDCPGHAGEPHLLKAFVETDLSLVIQDSASAWPWSLTDSSPGLQRPAYPADAGQASLRDHISQTLGTTFGSVSLKNPDEYEWKQRLCLSTDD